MFKNDSPEETLGLLPPWATLAIASMPSTAILPGYCTASAVNSPLVTSFSPAQLPSMAKTLTEFCLPAALSAA